MNELCDDISKVIEAEVAYLRNLVDNDYRKKTGRNFAMDTETMARNHACTSSCAYSFKNLNPNDFFRHDRSTWRATGNVYVCSTSKRVHLCGLNCTLARIIGSASSLVCPLTCQEVARGECYARTRTDTHVFRIGTHTVSDYVPSKSSEGITEGKAMASLAQQAADLNDQFDGNAERIILRQLLAEERARIYPDEDEDTRMKTLEIPPALTTPSKHTPDPSSSLGSLGTFGSFGVEGGEGEEDTEGATPDISILLKAAQNNDVLMYDTVRKHPTLSTQALVDKIADRIECRSHAAKVWEQHAMNSLHVRHIQLALRRATAEWFKAITLYYKNCIAQGDAVDKLHVMRLFCVYVLPSCEGLYCNADVPELNSRSRTYYIDCLARLWEKYQEVPAVAASPYKFKVCATAMLATLHTGLCIDVFFKPGDAQPRIWGDLTITEQLAVRSVKVTLIDAHPNLILAPAEVLRDIENGVEGEDVVLEFPTGKKINIPKTRGNNRRNCQSNTDRKPFNHVLEEIIRACPTIDALEAFKLSSIYPREKIPPHILRK